jgi:hypothetical protein
MGNKLEQRLGELAEDGEPLLRIGGAGETWADKAFMGVGSRCGQPDVLVYDYDKLVRAFAKANGCGRGGAAEYVDYNIAGAWVGDKTPILLRRLPEAGDE